MGVVAGVGSSLLVAKGMAPPQEPSTTESRQRGPSSDSEELDTPAAPRWQVRAVPMLPSSQEDKATAPTTKDSATEHIPEAPLDPATARDLHLQEHEEALAEHAREPIDATWARGANRSLETDLAPLSEAHQFRVQRVDCRTHKCVVTLEWKSYQDAINTYTHVLPANYDVNCPRRIILPEPEDPGRAYQANLIFDCETLRGSQVR
jgi:hypothetical protein